MNREHVTDRLSAYIDGELAGRELSEVESHLAVCADCESAAVEVRRVVLSAAELPPLPPERDLWPGIRGRLAPRHASAPVPHAGASVVPLASRRRVVLTVPQLLAAGIAVAALSAGVVWTATGGFDAAVTAGLPVAEQWSPSDVVLAAYEPAMTELELEYEARRGSLDPETIRVVERNLAIIDAAIDEARDALATDASSGFLSTHLANNMQRRMTLLRQVTSL